MKVSVATSSVKHSRFSACFAVGLLVLESESFATLVQDVSLAEWENVNRSSVLFCCFFVLRRSSYVLEIPFGVTFDFHAPPPSWSLILDPTFDPGHALESCVRLPLSK